MKKQTMVEMILKDMEEKKSSTSNEDIDKRWRSWLFRQSNQTLQQIINDRGIK